MSNLFYNTKKFLENKKQQTEEPIKIVLDTNYISRLYGAYIRLFEENPEFDIEKSIMKPKDEYDLLLKLMFENKVNVGITDQILIEFQNCRGKRYKALNFDNFLHFIELITVDAKDIKLKADIFNDIISKKVKVYDEDYNKRFMPFRGLDINEIRRLLGITNENFKGVPFNQRFAKGKGFSHLTPFPYGEKGQRDHGDTLICVESILANRPIITENITDFVNILYLNELLKKYNIEYNYPILNLNEFLQAYFPDEYIKMLKYKEINVRPGEDKKKKKKNRHKKPNDGRQGDSQSSSQGTSLEM